MISNPILEEVWRVKAQLAREANYDFDTFCAQLRYWESQHPELMQKKAQASEELLAREAPEKTYGARDK
jgi:hypothetical protein